MAEDDDRADEWDAAAQEAKTTTDGVPVAIEPKTPRPEHTGSHRISQVEFANAYARGLEHGEARGYARGLAEGRAEIKAELWEDGAESFARALHVYLLANEFTMDYAAAFVAAVRPFVKRGG